MLNLIISKASFSNQGLFFHDSSNISHPIGNKPVTNRECPCIATFLHVAVGYWELCFPAQSHLVTSLILIYIKKRVFNHSQILQSTYKTLEGKIHYPQLSFKPQKLETHTHFCLFCPGTHNQHCTCHMVSSRANSLFYILCSAALHTLKHYVPALSEGKQETHSFLRERWHFLPFIFLQRRAR